VSWVKYGKRYGSVRVTVDVDGGAIRRADIAFVETDADERPFDTMSPELDEALERYFAGVGWSLGEFPLDERGLTDFEKRVYGELRRVPQGTTVTYGELARRVGNPRAARAVGGALARNPFLLFVPCHRVVAAQGAGGWSGRPGMKEFLLRIEGVRFEQ